MTTQELGPERRCPRCHKTMMALIGQNDDSGWVEMQHDCWSCNYTEPDKVWRRPLPTQVGEVGKRLANARAAERLRQIRDRGRPEQVWVWDSETRQWKEAEHA